MIKLARLLWRYRRRLLVSTYQDIQQKYTGTMLGIFWLFLQPALQLSIYAVLYAIVFRVRVPGLTSFEYILLVFSGISCYLIFSESILSAMSSLSSNKTLLLNTIFPPELIPVRTVLTGSLTGLVSLLITLSLSLIFMGNNPLSIIPFLFFLALLIAFCIGAGMVLSLISLVARDIQHTVSIVMMVIFVTSPYAYTVEMVPQLLRPFLFANPFSWYVLAFQRIICYQQFPSFSITIGCAFLSLVSFAFGSRFFTRTKTTFFDYAG